MLEYARYYRLAEDYTLHSPIMDADESCEPQVPVPPPGLEAARPEQRMHEVHQAFTFDIMAEPLPADPEEPSLLEEFQALPEVNGSVWRGLLPVLETSDLGPQINISVSNLDDNPALGNAAVPGAQAAPRGPGGATPESGTACSDDSDSPCPEYGPDQGQTGRAQFETQGPQVCISLISKVTELIQIRVPTRAMLLNNTTMLRNTWSTWKQGTLVRLSS